MAINLLAFLLCSLGIALMGNMDFRPTQPQEKLSVLLKKKLKPKTKTKALTVKGYMDELEGKDKRSYLQKNQDAAKTALQRTGKGDKFTKTLLLSKILGLTSFFFCLAVGNVLLAPVLGIGLYFIPLWLTKLYVFRYEKFIREELETALSLITTSYIRHNDLNKAVSENIEHIKNPVGTAFRQFLQGLNFINANISTEIENLSNRLENKVFKKWCDTLILCQDDYTLKATLLPIVSKFSDIKTQQSENETNMMLPLKDVAFMTLAVLSPILLFKILNEEWFYGLVFTFWGQLSMAISAIWLFISINKAIELCSPIEYDV